MLILALLLGVLQVQTTLPPGKDPLGKERQVTLDYIDDQPKRVLHIRSNKPTDKGEGQPVDIDPGNSTKTIFFLGRSDVVFLLDDISESRSLSMYERQPGARPDKALWELEWRSDSKAKNEVGIARLMDCDLGLVPKKIRSALTSRRPFVVYWTPRYLPV